MKDCGGKFLGVCGNDFVKADKVQDLTRDDAFGDVTLHFGNVVRPKMGGVGGTNNLSTVIVGLDPAIHETIPQMKPYVRPFCVAAHHRCAGQARA